MLDKAPAVGIVMCLKRKLTVDYALRDYNKPMGVAEYRVTPESPAKLQMLYPTASKLQVSAKNVQKQNPE